MVSASSAGCRWNDLLHPVMVVVRDVDRAVRRHADTRGLIELEIAAPQPTPGPKKPAGGRELLHPVVERIHHVDVAVPIHRHACGQKELTVPAPFAAPGAEESAVEV